MKGIKNIKFIRLFKMINEVFRRYHIGLRANVDNVEVISRRILSILSWDCASLRNTIFGHKEHLY